MWCSGCGRMKGDSGVYLKQQHALRTVSPKLLGMRTSELASGSSWQGDASRELLIISFLCLIFFFLNRTPLKCQQTDCCVLSVPKKAQAQTRLNNLSVKKALKPPGQPGASSSVMSLVQTVSDAWSVSQSDAFRENPFLAHHVLLIYLFRQKMLQHYSATVIGTILTCVEILFIDSSRNILLDVDLVREQVPSFFFSFCTGEVFLFFHCSSIMFNFLYY